MGGGSFMAGGAQGQDGSRGMMYRGGSRGGGFPRGGRRFEANQTGYRPAGRSSNSPENQGD